MTRSAIAQLCTDGRTREEASTRAIDHDSTRRRRRHHRRDSRPSRSISTQLFQPFDADGSTTVGWFIHHPGILRIFTTNQAYNNHLLFSFLEKLIYLASGENQGEAVLRILPIAMSGASVGTPDRCRHAVLGCAPRDHGGPPARDQCAVRVAGVVRRPRLLDAGLLRDRLDAGALADDARRDAEKDGHDRLRAPGRGRHRDARLHGAARHPPGRVRARAGSTRCPLDQDVRRSRRPRPRLLCVRGQGHGHRQRPGSLLLGRLPERSAPRLAGRHDGGGGHRIGALGRHRGHHRLAPGAAVRGHSARGDVAVRMGDLAAVQPRHALLRVGDTRGRGGRRLRERADTRPCCCWCSS